MSSSSLRVALLSECFFGEGAESRLGDRLAEAKRRGAELVLLPELPLQEWRPWTKEPRDHDAEEPGGPRETMLRRVCRDVGIGAVGGVIRRDPASGRRESRVLLVDERGALLATYGKIHLPEEEGFWETSHYEPSRDAPVPVEYRGFPVGFQICSDCNRPQGTPPLGAQGALAVLSPRATEKATWERWRVVLRANAITSACYFLSVNRPAPEFEVLMGGPSLAVDPRGEILIETLEPLAVITLERARVEECRTLYPGYLARFPEMYSAAWRRIADRAADRIPPPER
jgi:predicted amidohydrolase